ncbi:MAG TPA: SagB/ThcOx family dehydrogenase [Candidatus Marinimicrobia bacterium]|nr:SagB/ThcOx family dehydrogenase [Candidatus Neomarinimicrobiota bacterium]HRS51049.1 SagB/ThcOx family dehydrogenase [Candidatus Neomarinimicrobiota bacterium]HRU92556.1 SagB/ThcOx family dehydrogenase [Candidatus Neomarinimicrobiota bacterium]
MSNLNNFAAEQGNIWQLARPDTVGKVSIETTLSQRRSVRAFKNEPLSEKEISQLLYAAQGISDFSQGLRTAPSAGATYPLEIYLVTAEGIFHYLPKRHAIELKKAGDYRARLADAALGQNSIRTAPATIVFSAVYERTTRRYQKRGERYVHIEVGHAAQNVHLQAVALGLASVPVGAFDDETIAKVIGVERNEQVLYLVPVGRKR